MKNYMFILFLALANIDFAIAGELNVPYTFVSGTPAKASEVNGNFSAAKTAIDDNSGQINANAVDITINANNIITHDSRMDALESSLAVTEALVLSLQTQINNLEAQNTGFSEGDLTGSIYCFINYGSELTGGAFPGVYTSHSNVVLTFTSATQLISSDGFNVDAFLNTNTGVNSTGSSSGDPSETVSYSLSGSTLTVFGTRDDGGNNLYHLTPDGNVLIGDNSSIGDSGNNHEADFSIAVRADSCI